MKRGKMAKTKKRVAKRKVSARKSRPSKVSVKRVSSGRNSYWYFFLNALFFALFVYAGYLLWNKPWTQGISLIVLLLVILLISKLIRKK